MTDADAAMIKGEIETAMQEICALAQKLSAAGFKVSLGFDVEAFRRVHDRHEMSIFMPRVKVMRVIEVA